jgi:hypothetical protein
MSRRVIIVILMCLIQGILGGCTARMKTLVSGGPGIPEKAGCYVKGDDGVWIELATHPQITSAYERLYGAMPANVQQDPGVLKVKNGKLLVAQRLTPSDKTNPENAIILLQSMTMGWGIRIKPDGTWESDANVGSIPVEDKSDYDAGYQMVEFTLTAEYPLYVIQAGICCCDYDNHILVSI